MLPLTGCHTSTSSSKQITVAGSTTCLPIAESAAEGYQDETGISVLVSGLGSSAGIEAVANGTADIASSSRQVNADEQKLGLTEIVIAHDGIAVIVNTDNPSGTREAFKSIVMDKVSFDRRAAVLSGTGQVRDVVSRSAGAIGYISLGFVESKFAETAVRAISVNHIEPSEKTIASGGYPISRDLYFYVKGTPTPEAQAYIDYVTSEKMDSIVRDAGFIPVTDDESAGE